MSLDPSTDPIYNNDEITQFFIDFLKCECKFIKGGIDQKENEIINWYHENLEKGKNEGFTPLIVIPDRVLLESIEIFLGDSNKNLKDPKIAILSAIEKSKEIDYKECIKRSIKEIYDEKYEENMLKSLTTTIAEEKEVEIRNSFCSYFNYSSNQINDVILAKIPTIKPYELACYVPMGGFNDCPDPQTQTAVFKYWFDKYKAYPAVVGYDTWEFYVEKLPQQKEEANELALEQFTFCTDRIEQYGDDNYTIDSLSNSLLKSHVWYFWWD